MANSSVVGESGKVSGHRSAFSRTCSLLSQYVKEKKAIGDLSLGMLVSVDERGSNNAFHPTTMNLFPVNDKPEDEQMLRNSKSSLFPQQASLAAPPSERQSSQMTIFYAGRVIVFNDFSADKAKEIMKLARRGISQESSGNNIPVVTYAYTNDTSAKNGSPQIQEHVQQPASQRIIADLPIARKASLHRFLEKRKDRIKAKAPYIQHKQVS